MQTNIKQLHHKAHRLLHLGDADGFVYGEEMSGLNQEVHELVGQLCDQRGETDEEEARLCLAVLMAYNGMIYVHTFHEKKRRSVFSRACNVLSKLSPSLLKCQLLVYCYIENYDEKFMHEARLIIDSWEGRRLSEEEREVLDVLKVVGEIK